MSTSGTLRAATSPTTRAEEEDPPALAKKAAQGQGEIPRNLPLSLLLLMGPQRAKGINLQMANTVANVERSWNP